MKKILFIISFLFCVILNAQVFDPPSGYTEKFGTNWGLRLYDYDDNPGSDSLNQNMIDIAEGFVKRAFEFQVNQIRVTNGTLLLGSSATLDEIISSSILKFQDVTGRGEVPFQANDVIFAQVIATTGEAYDANGNIVDSDALIRRAVYQVDSVSSSNGLLVYVSAHSDPKVPSNKGTMENGDVFVVMANTVSGVDLIELSSDLANAPRITIMRGLNNWSEYVSDTNKAVVIGNIGNLVTDNFGTVSSGTIGAYFNGGASGGNVILDNVDILMNNQSSIELGGFAGDLDDVDDGATYSKVLTTSISAGRILLSETDGSLDDIGDGATYGRILKTGISAGKILLSNTTGNLDDIADGTSYGRVLSTDITSGHIYLSSTVGSLDDVSDGSSYKRVAATDITSGHITVVASTASININDVTFGNSGIQLQYNGGSPRVYIGDGSTNYFQYSGGAISVGGGTITGGTIQTSSSGQRIILSSSNQIDFYSGTGYGGGIVATTANSLTFDTDLLGTAYFVGNVEVGDDLDVIGDLSVTGSYGLSAGDIPSGIDAANISGGSVSNTEFDYLNGLNGNIQNAFNARPIFRGEVGSNPSTPTSGEYYRNTSDGKWYFYSSTSSSWEAVN